MWSWHDRVGANYIRFRRIRSTYDMRTLVVTASVNLAWSAARKAEEARH